MRKLPKRLGAIASLIPEGSKICDVGTDHALLPVWLIVNGICDTAVATDISKNCLARAEESARAYGVHSKISFYLSDGLKNVPSGAWDTLVIAGMGGETIIDIISEAERIGARKKFILQPNTKQLELSQFLRGNGFTVTNEVVVRDRHRDYLIEVAETIF